MKENKSKRNKNGSEERKNVMDKKSENETNDRTDKNLKSLKRELDEKAKLADERLDQIKYIQADFENYKKGLDKQRQGFEQRANERLVKELLPVIDDLEAAAKKAGNEEAKKGYELINKKIIDILNKSGLTAIEAIGKKFDPYFHEAMMSMPSDKPEGTVLRELQKGYMFHSSVIRHSKVEVAKKRSEEKKI